MLETIADISKYFITLIPGEESLFLICFKQFYAFLLLIVRGLGFSTCEWMGVGL